MEVNPAMATAPEAINQDPYGDGWLAVIEAADWEARPGRSARPTGILHPDEGPGGGGDKKIMTDQHKVVIIPCSGIGKTYGTVSREAAYEVTDDIRPEQTQLVALSLLVLGDEETRLSRRRESGDHDRRLQAGLCHQNGAGERRDSGTGFCRAGCLPPL